MVDCVDWISSTHILHDLKALLPSGPEQGQLEKLAKTPHSHSTVTFSTFPAPTSLQKSTNPSPRDSYILWNKELEKSRIIYFTKSNNDCIQE